MSNQSPRVVHLIFKTHLDVGFTDYARNVAARYFSDFIPRALATARAMRERGEDRFVWTTGAWLIYECLERARPAERRELEAAIAAGDLAWHGLPFTTHSELMDVGLFEYGLSLAQELDRRFGRRTIAAKMTDVPGHTRGIVPLLADAGIQLLHIGVNGASTPPDVPDAFVWRDPSGKEIVVMYQRGGYGDLTLVPGLGDALAFAHTGDNLGPQTADEAAASFRELRERLPGARVVGSTLDAFAERLAGARGRLPVVTGEIGDTWIHGAGTDPKKVARFRELCRLRAERLADEPWLAEDSAFRSFSRLLLMVPEHTWGMDEKTHLADRERYTAEQLREARQGGQFRAFEMSWAEQRAYIDDAVAALGDSELAAAAHDRLATLAPARPSAAGLQEAAAAGPHGAGALAVGLDGATGAIARLLDRRAGREWATPEQPLALLRYQTFDAADYARFRRQYNVNKRETASWAVDDYTKPGIERAGAVSRWWPARLARLRRGAAGGGERLVAELEFAAEASERYGAPRLATLEIELPEGEAAALITLQWFDKPACRLPEALWLSFAPAAPDRRGWRLEKLGERISPLEVVRDGNRRLHAVGAGAEYRDAGGRLRVETLDAPLVAPGAPSLLDFHNRQPDMRGGIHVNLYNNIWGTNFPMWYEEDARFRFVVRL